jgi:5-methylcytosine-specific restriction endonuclease McrA
VDPSLLNLEEEEIRRERRRARELRASPWWRRRLAKGVCHWCGRAVGAAALTMDHVVPVARGGRSVKGNLVPCCKACNNAKQGLLPMEWEGYLERCKADLTP